MFSSKMKAKKRRRLQSLHMPSVAALACVSQVAIVSAANAQETYASVSGAAKLEDGSPAEDVTVSIIHTPSGSTARTRVNRAGRFNATGLRVGGPYVIRFEGEDVQTSEIGGLYFIAGDPSDVNVTLERRRVDEIVVVGKRTEGAGFGTVNTFDADRIRKTPVIERRLQEVIQLDPKAFVDFGETDENQGFSILGFNTRFNNIVVDGLSQQDSFGDNFTGLSTRRSPISLDAIQSLSVESAPFDVRNSGFQGGQVNIITRSGENELHGSAFYQRGGGFLSSKRAGTDSNGEPITFSRQAPENTYGATLSGPIINDRLFFFFSYEEFTENERLGSCPRGLGCDFEDDFITLGIYDEARRISNEVFGFEPGDYRDFLNATDGERKFLGKLDWNITDRHRASFTVQNASSNSIATNRAPGLDTPSSFASIDADIPIGLAAQLFSNWTDNFSTQIQYGYLSQRRVVTPLSGDSGFGQVLLQDLGFELDENGAFVLDENGLPIPGGDLAIGQDDFDQNNVLEADRFQYKFRAEYLAGDHRLSLGYERDARDIFNLEAPSANGLFVFQPTNGLTTLAAFEQGLASQVSVSAPTTADLNDAAADYTLVQNSWYVQDKWAVSDSLDLLFGLRYERFGVDRPPRENPFFIARYGFSNTATLDGRNVLLPRFGYSYRPFERTTFRGGVGVFAGGTPVTWFNEAYLVNGVTFAQATADANAIGGPVDPNRLPQVLVDALNQAGGAIVEGIDSDVSFLSPDFEIPRNLRFQFAIDQRFDLPLLGDDWGLTVEYIRSEVIEALQFRDIRIAQTGEILPTGTPRYAIPVSSLDTRPGNPSTGTNSNAIQDIGVFNTSAGHSSVVSFSLDKIWDFGRGGALAFNTGYAYTRSIDVSPANDTDDLDDVFETGAYDDVNNPTPGQSIQAVPHNFIYSLRYRKEFGKDWATSFSIFGNFRSGRATSLVIDEIDRLTANQIAAGLEVLQPGFSDRAQQRLLAYLPSGPDDPLVRYGANASYDQIATVINDFGLEEFQGGFIPRNSIRAESAHRIDLNWQLEVPTPTLPGKLYIDASIRNFLNLIDRDYGLIRRYDIRENFYQATYDPETNQIVVQNVDPGRPLIDEQLVSGGSPWRAQIGVRYAF